MSENKLNFRLINLLIVVAIICLLYLIRGLWVGILASIFKIISPFLLSFAIAYVIYPLVNKLIKAGAPKWLAILTVCILGIGILLILLFLTVPLLYEQTLLFLSNLTVLLSNLSLKYEINFGELPTMLSQFSSNIISSLGTSISSGAIGIFNTSINVFTNSIVVLCASIYFLVDMKKIRGVVFDFITDKSERAGKFIKVLDVELTKYIGGMGKNILVQGIEYIIALDRVVYLLEKGITNVRLIKIFNEKLSTRNILIYATILIKIMQFSITITENIILKEQIIKEH